MPSDLLRTLTTSTSGVVGTAFLRALVRQLGEAYDANSAYLAERGEDSFTVVAAWGSGRPEGAETWPGEAAGFVVPLAGADGRIIGLIAVEADEPLDPPDGAQQRLVVLGQRLDLARRSVREDPDKACTMLDAARSEMRAVGEGGASIDPEGGLQGLADRGAPATARSTTARVTSWRCCSVSPAGD